MTPDPSPVGPGRAYRAAHLCKVIPLVAAMALFAACTRENSSAETPRPVTAAPAAPDVLPQTTTADAGPLPSINSARAFQYTREVAAFGPRPVGSTNHKKLEDYIHAHLKGDEVEDDSFTAGTPEGRMPVRSIIAKYPGARDGIIVIAGHYDTNYPLRNTAYIGANDGGSSTAILLELAHAFRAQKRPGYSVWLVWTDGEEAIRQWTATDSLYGARHLAEKWTQDSTLKKIKAFILADMIGDADLSIEQEQNSTPWLRSLVADAATRYGFQSHFQGREIAIEDDHIPFVRLGVPSVDLIDMDYGYGDSFHHTPQDTMDKLSPKSLEIVGNVILETVHLLDQKK